MATEGTRISLEFSGGSELLFDKVNKHDVVLPPAQQQWTIRRLLFWIRDNLLKERPELFMQDNNLRPGILVLINDADWELLGEMDYKIEENDTVTFISTLHGG